MKRGVSGRREVNKFREAEMRGHMRQSPLSPLPQQHSCTSICAQTSPTLCKHLIAKSIIIEHLENYQHVLLLLLMASSNTKFIDSCVLLSDELYISNKRRLSTISRCKSRRTTSVVGLTSKDQETLNFGIRQSTRRRLNFGFRPTYPTTFKLEGAQSSRQTT